MRGDRLSFSSSKNLAYHWIAVATFFLWLPLPSIKDNIHKIQNLDILFFFFTSGFISSTSLGRKPNSSSKTFRISWVIKNCSPLVATVVKTGAAISLSSEADWAALAVKIQMIIKE